MVREPGEESDTGLEHSALSYERSKGSSALSTVEERLDKAVAGHFGDISRSYAATLIEAGAVMVNGVVAGKAGQRVKAGDVITVDVPAPRPSGLEAEDIPLSVVYEDADLLVVDKPA